MKEAIDFLTLLKEKESLENKLTEINKQVYAKEQELYDSMQSINSESISIEGIEFKPQIDESFSIEKIEGVIETWSDEAVFNWFKEKNMGDAIKTREEIHHATRTSMLKEYVSSGGELPDFIKQAYRPMIKYNKSAVKRLVNEK